MTVVYHTPTNTVDVTSVLWSKPEAIDAIVRAALVSQTEAFVDMIIDCQDDAVGNELTRNAIQDRLESVKSATNDFLEDVLNDLRIAVLARLEQAQYGAIVTGIKYGLAGDVTDIEVNTSVSYQE